MIISCCTWALSGTDSDILTALADAGFMSIDIRPFDFTTEASGVTIKDLNLNVSCIGLSFGMPDDASLDSPSKTSVDLALDHIFNGLSYASLRGAAVSYMVPSIEGNSDMLRRYAQSLISVADQAESLGIKVGIEHFPGRILPTVADTLAFINDIQHPNLYLLFDIGHAQISDENPVDAIYSAAERLGYVHLDDNDGEGDLHLSLLDGVLTEETLKNTFTALKDVGYNGPISLELNANLQNPLQAIKQSREIVENLL